MIDLHLHLLLRLWMWCACPQETHTRSTLTPSQRERTCMTCCHSANVKCTHVPVCCLHPVCEVYQFESTLMVDLVALSAGLNVFKKSCSGAIPYYRRNSICSCPVENSYSQMIPHATALRLANVYIYMCMYMFVPIAWYMYTVRGNYIHVPWYVLGYMYVDANIFWSRVPVHLDSCVPSWDYILVRTFTYGITHKRHVRRFLRTLHSMYMYITCILCATCFSEHDYTRNFCLPCYTYRTETQALCLPSVLQMILHLRWCTTPLRPQSTTSVSTYM